MNRAHDIIIKPIITERSTMNAAIGKYTFVVARNANKVEIRQAVEELFGVKVLKVNTDNYEGKLKRQGVHSGKTPSWKKAIITIDLEPKASAYLGKNSKKVSVAKKYKNTIEEFGFGS